MEMKVKITNPIIKGAILLHLLEKFDHGEVETLIESGVSPESLDNLRGQLGVDIVRLMHLDILEIHFNINDKHINDGLKTLNHQKAEFEDLAYFIENGASQRMLDSFFRMDPEVIRSYRRFLDRDTKPGRTSMPSVKVREEIQKSWHSIANNDANLIINTRAKLKILHQQFSEYSLDTLYAAATEFGVNVP